MNGLWKNKNRNTNKATEVDCITFEINLKIFLKHERAKKKKIQLKNWESNKATSEGYNTVLVQYKKSCYIDVI